jgi:hypothetical protein
LVSINGLPCNGTLPPYNAFYLVDNAGHHQAVRWVAVPQTTNSKPAYPQVTALIETGAVMFYLLISLVEDTDDDDESNSMTTKTGY